MSVLFVWKYFIQFLFGIMESSKADGCNSDLRQHHTPPDSVKTPEKRQYQNQYATYN